MSQPKTPDDILCPDCKKPVLKHKVSGFEEDGITLYWECDYKEKKREK